MKVQAVTSVAGRAVGQALGVVCMPLSLPLFVLGRSLQCALAAYTSPDERQRPPSFFPTPLDEATADLLG